ncbi:hypothetical protein BCT49_08295 [Vibrio lentus]|uniref:Uncharacterized protein n=1 Tax=Vibrio lentus TaxID=136468 RepID=A0A2N7K4M7_9VIBR|nr:hypothetical protein BCT49_08295 [Vibrio lentus]
MRSLILKINAPLEQPKPLLLGSFVRVTIQGRTYSNSFMVSSSSITADGNIWYVKEGVLHKHKTQTLFQDVDAIGFERDNLDEQIDLVLKPLSNFVAGMNVLALSDSPQDTLQGKLASNNSNSLGVIGNVSLQEVNDGQ